MDYDSAPDEVIEAREIQMTTIVFNETVLGDKRQLTIKGLTHFSKYTVTIKACHQKPDGVDMESMYCSEVKFVFTSKKNDNKLITCFYESRFFSTKFTVCFNLF